MFGPVEGSGRVAGTMVVEALAEAIRLHREGRVRDAEKIYRRVLDRHPDDPNALHFLGLVMLQDGQPGPAAEMIERAIEVDGGVADYHANLGLALRRLGRLDDAIAAYRRAIGLRPDDADAHNNLGAALSAADRADEAAAALRRAIELRPDWADPLNNLGVVLKALGDLEAAVEAYRRAVAIRPDHADAHYNLGNALAAAGRPDEAAAAFRRVAELEPDSADAHFRLGNALYAAENYEGARAALRRAVELRPDHWEARNNLGNALRELRLDEEAVTEYRRALAVKPDAAVAYGNLGAALGAVGRVDEAVAAYRACLDRDPGNAAARHMLAALTGETTKAAPGDYVAKLFDSCAGRFDELLVDRLGYRTPDLMRRAVDAARGLRDRPGKHPFRRALDLGCGTGLVAAAFRDAVETLHGVDLSPKMVEAARRKELYDALHVGDLVGHLEGLDDAAAYDLILAGDVFVYIGDLAPVFAAVRRRLGAGGLFAFSVERLDGEGFTLRRSGRYAHAEAHVRDLARRHGFAVRAVDRVELRTERGRPIDGLVFVLAAAERGRHGSGGAGS